MSHGYRVVTLAQDPTLYEVFKHANTVAWPTFLREADGAASMFEILHDFADYQFALYDSDTVVGVGHCLPFVWDGTVEGLSLHGWDGVILQAVAQRDQTPTAISALAAIVYPEFRGRGISSAVLQTMKAVAHGKGIAQMVAPVRPTLKPRYPLMSMTRYAYLTEPNSAAPFDPWLRVHWKLGARFLGIVHQSMTQWGTVAEWEGWTGLRFPESGDYVIDGALNPVTVDLTADRVTYIEPNVWMQHDV